MKKTTTLLNTYSTHYFSEVLPRLFYRGIFKVAVTLVFAGVVGASGKDEVLPQPDGSILSGGTVSNQDVQLTVLHCIQELM